MISEKVGFQNAELVRSEWQRLIKSENLDLLRKNIRREVTDFYEFYDRPIKAKRFIFLMKSEPFLKIVSK